MSDLPSPVKVAPPSSKKGRPSARCFHQSNWVVQRKKAVLQLSLPQLTVKCNDEVYMRFVDEFKTIENVQTENIQYHRSCYKSFTSKHDFSASVFSTTAQNVSNPTENTTSVSTCSYSVQYIFWYILVCIHACSVNGRHVNETTNYTRLHPMREQKEFWTWQHWPMMAKWYTPLLMMGWQRMQYIMLLLWHITYSKELRTTVKTI